MQPPRRIPENPKESLPPTDANLNSHRKSGVTTCHKFITRWHPICIVVISRRLYRFWILSDASRKRRGRGGGAEGGGGAIHKTNYMFCCCSCLQPFEFRLKRVVTLPLKELRKALLIYCCGDVTGQTTNYERIRCKRLKWRSTRSISVLLFSIKWVVGRAAAK